MWNNLLSTFMPVNALASVVGVVQSHNTAITNIIFGQITHWERMGDGLHRGHGSGSLLAGISISDVLLLAIAFVIIMVVVAFVCLWKEHVEGKNLCENRQLAYNQALSDLERNPDSIELRKEVLATGRAYCETCREQGKVALFDEVALANDLSARTGQALGASTKQCPVCTEQIQAAARMCHYCKFEFESPSEVPSVNYA